MIDASDVLRGLVAPGAATVRPKITLYSDPAGGTWTPVLVNVDQHTVNQLADLQRAGHVDLVHVPLPTSHFRGVEMGWLRTNQAQLSGQYRGQWVAIEGTSVVGHGPNLAAALDQARQAGHPHPFVTMLPGDPPVPFYGWRT